MPRLCEHCLACHPLGAKCARQLTLKQIQKLVREGSERVFKALARAEKAAKKHPGKGLYGVKQHLK